MLLIPTFLFSAPLREIIYTLDMKHNEISQIIVDTALYVHRRLGPGLLESVYLEVMVHDLRKRGLLAEKEVPVPVVWEDVKLEIGFRADIIVEGLVIVELKSVESIAPVHKKAIADVLAACG